jgi:putative membrane-bound dehydrogenase-like protein
MRRLQASMRLAAVTAGALLVLAAAAGPELWLSAASARQGAPPQGRPIRILFLGQNQERPHDPVKMFPLLAAPLARRGIQITYVATPAEALVPAKLKHYDGLMLYGNHDTLTPEQERALLEFVEAGKGVVAIHSASAEFVNSEKYIAMIGAQFQRSGTGEFTAEITTPAHPVLEGLKPFSTSDETFVHTKHNPTDRTVLMERVDASGREPLTWVRTQGRGRVFYTAYGHDERTWSKPEFTKLIENAVTWTVDETAREARIGLQIPEVVYVDGYNVPNYENRSPAPKYQLPFSPTDALKFVQAPAEFEVQLFASEPDVIKPITLTFDERGRLWVIEAHDYPNEVLQGNPGDDVIKILEDTNNDGKADKVTVFADGINLATSLVFANGGVIVAAQPHFLFLRDTNGDDKADVKQILNTGWGTRDTHAGPSNLQYGPDNYIYGTVGYSGFNGQMNGRQMQFGQGAWRMKPDGSSFEYLTSSTNNTWGLGINETGDVFGSTANGDPSWYLGIPNRYFEGVQGLTPTGRGAGPGYQSIAEFTQVHYTTPYIRQVDNMNSYTAGAGHMFYTARQYPREYWNRIAFVTEPTVHIVGQLAIEPQGAGYVARDAWNLISSAEEWSAPVHAMTGPDGAVWVSEWYNFIAQHNPTPTGYSSGIAGAYETAMRDKLRGRIYRVAYKDAAASDTRSLSRNDPAGLVAALASKNMFWRLTAQRLLVERNQKDVVPQLLTLVRNTAMDEVGINGGAYHALWTLHGLGELNDTTTESYRAAVEALKHPAAGVRKAAAQVLPRAAASANAIISAGVIADKDLHTRLAALLVMSEMPQSPEIAQALYKASQLPENYGDTWLARAIYIAASRHQQEFLAAYKADRNALPFSGLSVPLRLGNLTPDWRMPPAAEVTAEWKDMPLPGNWEARGLPGFDGSVWFTRTVVLPATTMPDTLSLGPIRNTAQVWVNGTQVQPPPATPPAAATPAPAPAAAAGAAAPAARGGGGGGAGAQGRGAAPAPTGPVMRPAAGAVTAAGVYQVPAGTLKAGPNTITVRVQNSRADGGFVGAPTDMYLMGGGPNRTQLAGTWKYRIERAAGNAVAVYTKPGELAAHLAFNAAGGLTSSAGLALPVVTAVPDVVLQLGVIPNEMKYALPEMTVQAGQLVEIVFVNSDQMQHNFVLGTPGSLQAIGAAADELAAQPTAAAQAYVPEIAQIIVKTPLVSAGQSLTFQFRAPAEVGDYPYVCTFPGHWRLMNGVLHVIEPQGRGRGAGGRGGAGRGGAPAGGAPPAGGRGQ